MLRRCFHPLLAVPTIVQQLLPPPTLDDISRMRTEEKALQEQLRAMKEERHTLALRSYEERKESVNVLEQLKDRYVTMLRQQMIFMRSLKRRRQEHKNLLALAARSRNLSAARK